MTRPLLLLLALPLVSASAQDVDAVFQRFDSTHGPGCAVAVSRDGTEVFASAYGMADLEHDVANTARTVFEPGSVSKQFTAAATILLALEGKLSLDDDIRKYIPELPDYGDVVTIRHLLNHTSGLRDWGAVAGIEGWPRTTRVHTHKHMLDIASRQLSLNYPPGEYYSYTNTGYNLQAVLVERVSGMSFAEFTKQEIFEPLGMNRTEWRDDYRRVVKDRAIAYGPLSGEGYAMNMPFENVHGNGGLLTTVGDLLLFTHNLETGALWGPEFIREMHTQGVLNSGRTIAYASGLFVGEYRGVREVQHSGSTAGYRGYLARYPDQGVAVAVMCNVSSARAGQLAHGVADLYLTVEEPADTETEPAYAVSEDRLDQLVGRYVNQRTHTLVFVTAHDGTMRLSGTALQPTSETRFVVGANSIEFDPAEGQGRVGAVLTDESGDFVRLEPAEPFAPSGAALSAFEGSFRSDEAEVTYQMVVEDGVLVAKDRYGDTDPLSPLYPDAFRNSMGTILFRRDRGGKVTGLSLVQGRVWDLRFRRLR
ncbi:MAG: CubicO group peptidase (beta-lactamase class C family) [Rhodothermales bacterium]|jgi:CubicO group peptidase (beta-lactamase class C family)